RVAGRERVEALGQLDVAGVHAHREAQVLELLGLALDGLHDPRVGVPDVHDRDAGREVEVALALYVPDVRAPALHGVERVDARRTRCDGRRPPLSELLVGHLKPPLAVAVLGCRFRFVTETVIAPRNRTPSRFPTR